eukprot:m.773244 g.773244  ORF g.773244 m.773244 type:complete len:370 (+) comp23251_c0_seq1:487-1596(+)
MAMFLHRSSAHAAVTTGAVPRSAPTGSKRASLLRKPSKPTGPFGEAKPPKRPPPPTQTRFVPPKHASPPKRPPPPKRTVIAETTNISTADNDAQNSAELLAAIQTSATEYAAIERAARDSEDADLAAAIQASLSDTSVGGELASSSPHAQLQSPSSPLDRRSGSKSGSLHNGISQDIEELQHAQAIKAKGILDEVMSHCLTYGIKFTDSDFPSNNVSLYFDGNEARNPGSTPVGSLRQRVMRWVRPRESTASELLKMFGVNTKTRWSVFRNESPSDVSQGSLGDCWFLSAVAAIVEIHPGLIRKLFITDEVNECGAYCLQLCKDGVWQHVLVDDLFPAYSDGRYLILLCEGLVVCLSSVVAPTAIRQYL